MERQREGQEERLGLRERFADAVEVSKEIVLDAVMISSLGNRELMIENYKSILSYSETCIKIKAKPLPVIVIGSGLEIRHISKDLLYLKGRVQSISFGEENGRM